MTVCHRCVIFLDISNRGDSGGTMLLQRTEYDARTRRAYVEFRERDGDAIATIIFSYRSTLRLSKSQLQKEVVRLARHVLKKAAAAT